MTLSSFKIDANGVDGAAYLRGQLVEILKSNLETLRKPIRAFDLFPTDLTQDPGAAGAVWMELTESGEAKVVGDFADDLPTVGVDGKGQYTKYALFGTSYQYSIEQIRQGVKTGEPLDRALASASAQAHRRAWNRAAFYGIQNSGVPGLLTNASIPEDDTAVTYDFSTEAGTQAAIDDVLRFVNDVNDTDGAEEIDRVLVDSDLYLQLATRTRSGNSDTTGLQWIEMHSGVRLERAKEIGEAQRTANMVSDPYSGKGSLLVAYAKDPSVLSLRIPGFYEELPPQPKSLHYIVNCMSRIGGLIIQRPASVGIRSNITLA